MGTQDVTEWLMSSDPAIRWQTMRDLLAADEPEWRAERSRVESDGWGARLLSLQDDDGQWDGGAFFPAGFNREEWERDGQPWTATCWSLAQLRELGLERSSDAARGTVRLVGEHSRWDHDGQPYWDGEVEECINGRTVADGAYFGVDVSPIVERLLGEQLADGGWNCERERGSVRSSFDTTINVLEGLLEYQRSGGALGVDEARRRGEEYLLTRSLMRRLSTGEVVDDRFRELTYPCRWRYDVLRALDHFRAADVRDDRLGEAIELVRSKRQPDGRWLREYDIRGRRWFDMDDGVGRPSVWVTLRAARVLRWWDAAADS